MANYVWNGNANDGNWSTAQNWGPVQGVPGASDTATIGLSVAGAINVSNQAILDLTINKFVTLNVGDNTTFTFGSSGSAAATFANSGTLALNSGNDFTGLDVAAPTLSLTGTGTVLLGNDSQNYLYAGTAGNVLNNVSNLIEGAGFVGDANLGFINGATGILDANQSAGMILNTGTSVTQNSGLLEATGAGALTIRSVVVNGTSGKISTAGANVYLQGGDIQGGTIASSLGGVFESNNGTFDGSTSTLSNTGTVSINDNTSLDVLGTISNSATLQLNSTNDGTSLLIDSATVSLTGSGTVALDNNTQNYISAVAAGNELDDVNNLIEGAGQIGGGTLSFVLGTAAVLNANQSAGLYLSSGPAVTQNSGLMEASGAGTLFIRSVVNNGTLGKVTANGANVFLQNGDLEGGTISSSGADLINNASGTLDGTSNTVTNTGTVVVNDNTSLDLLGTISNKGTINLGSTNDATYLNIGITTGTTAGTVTLTGSGQILLDDNANNYITDGIVGDTLVNLNNTISGGGSFSGSLSLINDATIDANAASNALEINTAVTVTNSGTLEATVATDGGLGINSVISNGTSGTILAAGGFVYLQNGSLQGGTIKTSSGGEVIETNTGTLDGSAHAVTNLGTVAVEDNRVLDLLGSIVNNGTIALNSTNDNTYLEISSPTVSLTGTGVISLDNDTQNFIFGEPASDELDNVSNTIEGAGQIGSANPIVLVNGAHGVIDADLATALELNVGNNGSNPVANSGLIEATGTGGLTIYNTTVNDSTGGTILASAANVDLNTGTIQGGVINSSGGGAVVAVGGTNLLDGTSQAVTIKGSVAVDDNQGIGLAGTINNEGTINDNSTNDNTVIEITSASVTLTGGGNVILDDNSQNFIYGAAAADVLDNVNNTIEGGGQLGDNQMTLVNGTAGTISATGTNNQLVINTGSNSITNSGLIEAVGPAGLRIQSSTVSNGTTGVISGAGGVVYLNSSTIQGGLLTESSGGSFVNQSGSTLDGSAITVKNEASITVNDNTQLFLLGTITNAGTISLASTNDNTDLVIGPNGATGTVTLTGGGDVVMSNDGQNYIYGENGGSSTLINLNNTISGGGTLGDNGLVIINDSVINADDGDQLTIDGGAVFTNNDLLESTGAGGLYLDGGTISNGTAGTMSASGGTVSIGGADILGGTFTGTGGFFTFGGATLDGTANEIVNDASITVDDNTQLFLLGTIDNAGTISLASTNDNTDLVVGPNGATGTVTLTGGGGVVLSNDGQNYIYGENGGSSTLINLNNTISGGGTLGDNGLVIINDSVIDADDASQLTIDGGAVLTNNDLLESTGSGGLYLDGGTISNGTVGTISASGGTVSIGGADILGGTFTGTGGFFTFGGATLDGTANEIVNDASITVYDNTQLFLLGTIDNAGTISLASTNDGTDLLIGPNGATGTVTLTGGGGVVLSNDGQNYIYGRNGGSSTLLNLNNTISGGGTLGDNGLVIINDSVIDADDTQQLTIDGSSLVTNNDLIESTGAGGLLIYNTTVSNGPAGTLSAAAGNMVLQSATIEGGLITSTSTYTIYTNSGSALGAAIGTLTNTGSILVQDNSVLFLDGAIDNNGSITVDSGGDTTQLNANAATVTLTGTGTIVLSNNGNNYVDGAGGNVLDNVGNTIEGGGNFGNGQLNLINGGIVEADAPTALNISLNSTGTNLAGGQFLAENGATLAINVGTFTNSGLIQADDASFVTFSSGATLTNNANNGTLTGGSYGAVSTGDGATLSVTGSAVSVIAATIILSGTGSTIEFGGDTIDSTLGSIASGGTLSLANGRVFTEAVNSGALADSGLISLAAGTFSAASLAIASGGGLSGYGSVQAPVSDAGTITASGGTLLFTEAVSGTGKLTAATGSVADLTTGGALTEAISGAGTLQLDNAAYSISAADITIGTVNLDAGATLSGTGTLAGALIDNGSITLSGGTLVVGGALSGAGTLSVASASVLGLNGGGSFAGTIISAGTVDIAGALTLTAGAALSATTIVETANLTLASVSVTNASGQTFDIDASAAATVTLGSSGTGKFTNAGSLVVNGAGTADIAAPFVDTGTASVTSGTLLIAGALSGTGTLSAASGAVIDLAAGGTLTETFSGAGTLELSNAGFFISDTVIPLATLEVNAGAALSGTGTVSGALIDYGSVTAAGGTMLISGALSGTGTLAATSGAVLDLAAGGTFGGSISGAGTVIIAGATTLDAGASLSVKDLSETANLTLASVSVTNASGNVFDISAATGATVTLGSTGNGSFTNAGSLVANGMGTTRISSAFINNGTASVTAGTLQITGALSGNGTLSVASGAVAYLSASGALPQSISGAGTLQLGGNYTLSGADLTVATVQVNAPHVLSGTGTIAGKLIVDGTAEALGGTLLASGAVSGNGTVSAASGAVLDLKGGGTFAGAISGAGTVEIAGVTTLDAGTTLSAAEILETASITLASVSVTNASGDIFAINAAASTSVTLGSSGTGSFTNLGSLVANGAGTARITTAFVDDGTVSVTSGSLQVAGAFTGNGTLAIGSATSAYLTAGGALSQTVSGAGTLIIGAAYTLSNADDTVATVQVNGPHELSGTGTLTGALINSGTVAASGGTLLVGGAVSGNGTLSAASGAVLDLKGGGTIAGAISGTGTVEVAGVTTLDAGTTLSAAEILETASITLASVSVTNASGDIFAINAAASTSVTLGSSGTGSFTNLGSLVANGAGTARITTAFVDNGTVSVTSGSLQVAGAFTGNGTLAIGSATSAYLTAGGALSQTVSGAGTLIIGAAYTLSNADDTVATVQVNGPHELSGTGTLTGALINSGTVAASGGTLVVGGAVSGNGTLSAVSGAVLDLKGGGTIAGAISGTGTVILAGATTLDAGTSLSAAEVVESANVTLASVSVTNTASDTFAISAISGNTVSLGSSGTASFTNLGTLLVNGLGTAHITTGLVNNNTVSVTSGSLQVTGAFSGNGTLAIGGGAAAYITAGGALTQSVSGAGTLQLGANYTLSNADLTVGTVQVNGPHVLSGTGTITGALIASGTAEALGGTLLVGGAISGIGTLSAGSGAVLDLTGGGVFAGAITGTGTVDLAGATTLDAGTKLSAADIIESANVTLASVGVTNTAADTFAIAAASGATVTLGSSGSGSFTNAGTLVASGPGTARISAALIDSGTVSVTSGSLQVTGALSGAGTLAIGAGTSAYITAGGALTETISGAGTLILGGAYTISNADLTVSTVQVNGPHSLSGTGTLSGNVIDSGTVAASGGTLKILGAVSGSSTLTAGSAAVLDLAGGGSFAGTITGAGTVALAGATTLDAGAKLSAAEIIESANVTLASVGVTNTAGDIYALTAGNGATITLGSSGTGAAFTNAGSLTANGTGTADISAAFTNSGTVSALSGTLSFLSSIAGTGTIDLGAASTLSLGLNTGSGQTLDFLGTTGVLDLATPLDFAGTITGFGNSDQIFLENSTETGTLYSGGVLTVKDGSTTIASLHITESSNSFTVVNENHGVLITFG